jgi:hypothetical protein
MEILVTAILGALAKLSDSAVQDAYRGLKALIARKFGSVAEAIESLERKPDSDSRRKVLEEELHDSAADRDTELLAAAEALLERVQALPDGRRVVQQISQTVRGSGNIFSGTGDVSVTNPGSRKRN